MLHLLNKHLLIATSVVNKIDVDSYYVFEFKLGELLGVG